MGVDKWANCEFNALLVEFFFLGAVLEDIWVNSARKEPKLGLSADAAKFGSF